MQPARCKMKNDWGDAPDHSILPEAWKWRVVGLHLDEDPEDGSEAFLDLYVKRGPERRALRFWSPREVRLDRSGPISTSGIRVRDLSGRGMEGVGVRVESIENQDQPLTFVARAVGQTTSGRQ